MVNHKSDKEPCQMSTVLKIGVSECAQSTLGIYPRKQ